MYKQRIYGESTPARPASHHNAAETVQRAVDGDRQAWEAIVDRYGSLLWSVALSFRLDHEQCADAVQETWFLLFQHMGNIRNSACLPGWLATTTRNNCLAIIRRSEKERAMAAAYHENHDHDPGPEEQVLRFERHEFVRQALQRLPARDQGLLRLLAESPPASYRDISRRLGIPIGSIGPTRQRALARLRDELVGDHAAQIR